MGDEMNKEQREAQVALHKKKMDTKENREWEDLKMMIYSGTLFITAVFMYFGWSWLAWHWLPVMFGLTNAVFFIAIQLLVPALFTAGVFWLDGYLDRLKLSKLQRQADTCEDDDFEEHD